MPRRLALVCSTAVLVSGLGVTTAALAPSTATAGPAGQVPVAKAASRSLAQGLVADAATGRYLDDVDVRAVESDGVIAASGFTYASLRADGPQHGYYYLHARPGTYDVEVRADGYQRAVIEDVRVTRNHRTTLDDIRLVRREAPTRTTATARDASLTTKQVGTLQVRVASSATPRPVGVVVVKEGSRTVGRAPVSSARRGAVEVGLGRLAAGRHTFKVNFVGGTGLKDSSSRPVVVTVRKAPHHGR